MEVKAIAKNIRVSPEKVLLVVDQIKKMKPSDAINILGYTPKRSAKPLKKVIASAVANAKNNFGLIDESLMFKSIHVGKGPMFKRYRAVSRGRAHAILRRTSHITVILEGEERKKEAKVETIKKIKDKKEKVQ